MGALEVHRRTVDVPNPVRTHGVNRALRVLLIHANPFQRVLPVPPYGLERIKTAAGSTGAEIEILDPYLISADPHETVRQTVSRFDPHVIGMGVRIIDDSVVIERLDAPDSEPTDVTWFLPEIRELRETLRSSAPDSLLVLGGATFSYVPLAVLDYLDVEWGVVGPGEEPFSEILRRYAVGQEIEGVPRVIRRGGPEPIDSIALAGPAITHREAAYAPTSCFPVRTQIGCAMKCSYCLTSSLHGQNTALTPEEVVDEIEAVVGHARRRGLSPVPLFFADDEFNLPSEDHARGILEGIVARGLARHVQWRAYFNPVPFSSRLAALIARTNGHASITVDTASESVMARNRKPFRLRHLETTLARVEQAGVSADMTFLFGLPGETSDTIRETIDFLRDLPGDVSAGYGIGARVYPKTPLAREAEANPDLLVGASDPSFLAPVVFCSPVPPRELSRRLARELADVPHVSQSRGGYGAGVPTPALAYRVAAGLERPAVWSSVLEQAVDPRLGRQPHEMLGNALLAALWHGRYELAATTSGEIAGGDHLARRGARMQARAMAGACSAIARLAPSGVRSRAQRSLRISRLALRLSAATKPW